MQPDLLDGDIGDPPSLNRYTYVENMPAVLTDPLGLFVGPPGCYVLKDPTSPENPIVVCFDQGAGGGGATTGPGPGPVPGGGAGGNGCSTSGFGGGILVGYGASVDAGAGATGVTATGSVAGGLFYGSGNGFSAGALASGGAAAYALGHVAGAPTQTGQPFSLGAYVGAGPTVTVTNARSVQQLAGPFTTMTLNVGVGAVKGSVQLSFAKGIFELSVGPPIPYVSPGFGFSVSKVTTNTVTTKTGCGG